jgi:hypothetical protein
MKGWSGASPESLVWHEKTAVFNRFLEHFWRFPAGLPVVVSYFLPAGMSIASIQETTLD